MLIPATRYTDCEAALTFLTQALGLTPHAVHRGDTGAIVHVEMALGAGFMMFGPRRASEFDELMVDPGDVGGETTTIYVIVDDVAAHHDRAVRAGAEIVMPLQSQDYGGSSFTARDPEGHVWSFGDYDPRAASV